MFRFNYYPVRFRDAASRASTSADEVCNERNKLFLFFENF